MSFLTLVSAVALGMFVASLLEQGFRLVLLMIYSRRLSDKIMQSYGQAQMDRMMQQGMNKDEVNSLNRSIGFAPKVH